MYLYTMLPLILAGVLNMVWVNTSFASGLQKPMDNGRYLRDGQRLFGSNKTWKGFWGMVVLCALTTLGVQTLAYLFPALRSYSMIPYAQYSWPVLGLLIGSLWGLAYVLAELPNSFVKRRLQIPPGKNNKGFIGRCFIVIDQADSVIGCVLVMPIFCSISFWQGVTLVLLATGIHCVLNVLLFIFKLKKQYF